MEAAGRHQGGDDGGGGRSLEDNGQITAFPEHVLEALLRREEPFSFPNKP